MHALIAFSLHKKREETLARNKRIHVNESSIQNHTTHLTPVNTGVDVGTGECAENGVAGSDGIERCAFRKFGDEL